jgi:hypothetical protein
LLRSAPQKTSPLYISYWMSAPESILGLAVCPYTGDLHHVVAQASRLRLYINNRTVIHQKNTGDPIPLKPILAVIDHIDVIHYDATGAAELQSTEDRRKALSQDGNQTLWTIMPVHTKSSLQASGMLVQSLQPSEDDASHTITGALVEKNASLRKQINRFLLQLETSKILQNQELNTLLPKFFDMTHVESAPCELNAFADLQHNFNAMDNRIFAERDHIASTFTALTATRIRTTADLLGLTYQLRTYSIIFAIHGGKIAFGPNDPQVLIQIIHTIQASVPHLDHSIQSQVNDALSALHALTNAHMLITPILLNNFLVPLFSKVSKDPVSSVDSAFAAMTVAPGPRSESRTPPVEGPDETAYYSRPETRPRPQYDHGPRQPHDSRQRLTVHLPVREVRRVQPVQEQPRHTPRPARADSPIPSDADIAELTESIKARQKKLSEMKKTQKAFLAQPFPSSYDDGSAHPPEYAYHAAIPPSLTLSSHSTRSSRRSSSNGDF